MAESIRNFEIDLYQEHLEEASFLYEQRLAYLHDPEINWPELGSWEARLEAHLDALVVGSGLALDVCREQATVGDAGQVHAALRVFCRQRRKDFAFALLTTLDPEDEEVIQAAAQALCFEAPPAWRDDLLRVFQGNQQHLTHLLARVIGYRRFAAEDALTRKLATKPAFGNAELAWALGRVGSAASAPALWPLLESDDARVCEAAAIALLRLGDNRPLQRATLAAQIQSWPRRVLAVGGNASSVNVLLDALKGQSADEAAVLGLGLLGDLAAVAPLVDLLKDEELSRSAAVALNTITGAGMHAEVFVPEDVDADELLDEERAAYDKDGTVPTRDGGEPYGHWEYSPMREEAQWRAWLAENKGRFSRGQRWRMGKPYGPAALLACLRNEASPYAVRAATYEELVVRYDLQIPFEVDLPIHQQMRYLKNIENWLAQEAGKTVDGRWYLAGQSQR